jgi:predicted unusual protein kinase regulating ubiquinone biosynthesis (AarF/ABC1/UbiB family)
MTLYASTLPKKITTNTTATDTYSLSPTSQKLLTPPLNTNSNNKPPNTVPSTSNSLGDRIASSSLASAAVLATAAVNAAVARQTIEAPDIKKSYVTMGAGRSTAADDAEEELPRTYDKVAIETYWKKERNALNQRWGQFVQKAIPFFSRLITLYIRDGQIAEQEIPGLSRQARLDLQDLGPTFIKAGQMMSVRPDVLPPATLLELEKLQDAVEPFDTDIAKQVIEKELGGPLSNFFLEISEQPIAAASLAQVYRATLLDGTDVAVKVQRPDVLSTVSKDLYVLRRAAEVFNGLVQRFAPQQRTNYVALLNEWAIGFYTELDFANEAFNQQRLRQALLDRNITSVLVPEVYERLCTRRVLVSAWIEGRKLSECSEETIAKVTPAAQEAFLTQLFDLGFFHADPHPGNLLVPHDPARYNNAQVALIDCGLMATIQQEDRDNMISAVIHLANKNYAALVDGT